MNINKKTLVILVSLVASLIIAGVIGYETFYNIEDSDVFVDNSNVTVTNSTIIDSGNNTVIYPSPTATPEEIVESTPTPEPTITPSPTPSPSPTPMPKVTIEYRERSNVKIDEDTTRIGIALKVINLNGFSVTLSLHDLQLLLDNKTYGFIMTTGEWLNPRTISSHTASTISTLYYEVPSGINYSLVYVGTQDTLLIDLIKM